MEEEPDLLTLTDWSSVDIDFPLLFLSAGHVKSLQISAGYTVSGHLRCSYIEG